MKRDMDLMRNILLRIEERSDVPPKKLYVDDFADMNNDLFVVSLHISLMRDAGLIEVCDSCIEEDGVENFAITRLTLAGYDYLDAVRSAKVWRKVKARVGYLGGVGIDVLKRLATNELSKELGL